MERVVSAPCNLQRKQLTPFTVFGAFVTLHRCSIQTNHQTGIIFFCDQGWSFGVDIQSCHLLSVHSTNEEAPDQHWIRKCACILFSMLEKDTSNVKNLKMQSPSSTHNSHIFSHLRWGHVLGRCSREAVSSKGLLWAGIIQVSVLSAGEGSRGKALEVPGEVKRL